MSYRPMFAGCAHRNRTEPSIGQDRRPKIGSSVLRPGLRHGKGRPIEDKPALPLRFLAAGPAARGFARGTRANPEGAHRIYLETGRKTGDARRSQCCRPYGWHTFPARRCGGKARPCALRNANLAYANLERANLIGADLGGACLTGPISGRPASGANLDAAQSMRRVSSARTWSCRDDKGGVAASPLQGADMSGINLEGADLRDADLRDANLRGANLRRAHMDRADLRAARLGGAFLDGASLRQVDLRGAYLRVARFDGADLSAADLRDTQGLVRAQLATALSLTDSRLPTGLSAPE